MLRGRESAKVDDKGRVKIPSEFLDLFLRLCGEGRRVFITSRDGVFAEVYPLPVWERYEKQLAELPKSEEAVENLLRAVAYWGREVTVDAQGRLLLPPDLRDRAKLNGEVAVFGKQEILEICEHDHYRREPPVLTREDKKRLAELKA